MADFSEELAKIDPAVTQAGRETITSVMTEAYPGSKWQAGDQLEGLVVEPIAYGYAFNEQRIDAQEASFSLAVIEADPTAADDALVDNIMSNYLIERQQATVSFGTMLVIVSRSTITPVADGAVYSIGSQEYVTTRSWRVYPPGTRAEDIDSGILVMEQRSDGNFQFLLPVQSVNTGSATLVSRGTVFTPEIPFPNQVSVTAASDFAGGLDADTNEDLVARARQGITPKTHSGFQNIEQSIATQFPGSVARVVGANSPLMSRDRDNLFGVSTGGKADIYTRVENYPRTETLVVSAQLSVVDRAEKRWRVTYDLPGAYLVTAIRTTDENFGGGLSPATETVQVKEPSSGFIPKMNNFDATFTAHQLRTVTFIDTTGLTEQLIATAGANDVIYQEWELDILAQGFIEDVDVFVRDRDRRDPGQDPLVIAAVPCLTSVRVIVRGVVDQDAAKDAIVDAIAALPPEADTIPASLVYNAIAPFVTGNVSTVYYSGEIIGRDLKRTLLTNKMELMIPDLPSRGIAAESTMFMARAEDISIEEI